MATDIVRIFNDTVGVPYAEEAAQCLSATRHQTANALHEILPALVHSITLKATSDAGANALLDFLKDPRIDPAFANRLGTLYETGVYDRLKETGGYILKYLLGDALAALTDHVARETQFSTGASSELTKITAAILASALARHVEKEGLDAKGLRSILATQPDALESRVPDGLRKMPGRWSPDKATSLPKDSLVLQKGPQPSRISKILPWFTLLISALALLYFVDRGFQGSRTDSTIDRENLTVTLKDGTHIDTYTGSFSARFVEGIESTGEQVTQGYLLDEVAFEANQARLLSSSYPQLDRLASILRAYDQVSIRLEGHTDDLGDATENLSLSNQRARAVMSYLVDQGIDRARLRAIGRGPSKPVRRDDSADGGENNRIEVYREYADSE